MKARFIVLALCIATTSSAQSQLASLAGFLGTWKCTGTTFASEMGPEHPTTATVTVRPSMEGKWLETIYAENKTAKNPMPYGVVNHWGWDEGQKKLVSVSVDNMGGYGVATSSGLNDKTLIFEGTTHMGPMAMKGRDTFTLNGNTATHSFSSQDNSGGWKKYDEETCKK